MVYQGVCGRDRAVNRKKKRSGGEFGSLRVGYKVYLLELGKWVNNPLLAMA